MAAPVRAMRVVAACSTARAATTGSRRMSVLAARPFDSHDDDVIEFPRRAKGLNYELNWSLAADGLTTRGEAYRNADVRALIEAAPRGEVKLSKERSVQVVGGAMATANETLAFATDISPGATVMDVEEFEGRLQSLRSQCLAYAPRLFVEDGAVGSSRDSELRVRVVTDSPVVALYFRSMLHRVPLYGPEVFPRTVTVYAATLAGDGVDAWAGIGKPYTVIDVDPSSARGVLACVGPVSLTSLRHGLLAAAGQLQGAGGYRHVTGGIQNASLTNARKDGALHWYMRDGHYYAQKSEAHPEMITTKGAVVLGPAGGTTLVVGSVCSALPGAAAAKGRLYSAHGAVWTPAGLNAFFGGISVPSSQVPTSAPLGRGTLVAQGVTTMPLLTAKSVPAPAQVIIVGGDGADAAAKFAYAGKVSAKAAERVSGRLAGGGVSVITVATPEEAMKALNL